MFYVNGTCLGVAAEHLPPRVYAIVDLYGQCVKVRIRNPPLPQPAIPIIRPVMDRNYHVSK